MSHCRVCGGWCRVRWLGIPAVAACVLFALACFTRNFFGPTDAPITYPGVSEGTPIPTAVPGPNDSPTWYARRGDGGRE